MDTKRTILGGLAVIVAVVAGAVYVKSTRAAESQSTNFVTQASAVPAGGGPSESNGTNMWCVVGGPFSTEPASEGSMTMSPGFMPVSEGAQFWTAAPRDRWTRYR